MQFIDLKTQQERIRPQIDAAIQRVLEHGRYIMGPEVFELEKVLAEFVGVEHCVSCSSGTDALLLPLMAYDLGSTDAVFTTPFTFFATPEAIALAGGVPVFVDIDPDTYNMNSVKLLETIEAVESEGRLTPRGVVPVDLFGVPADYDEIIPIAKEHGLFVLTDSAQSFGAEYKGRRMPGLGDVGATSFFPAKPLGCYGDGGAIFTNDSELAGTMRSMRVHGQGEDKYNNVHIGLNGRLDTLQAAILLEKMKIYPEEIDLRQKVARMYIERLGAIASLSRIPNIPDDCRSVFAQFCIESDRRTVIQAALEAADIPSPIYYAKPMHKLDAMQGVAYSDPAGFPVAEGASERIFALPFHPYLSENDIDRIVEVIADCG